MRCLFKICVVGKSTKIVGGVHNSATIGCYTSGCMDGKLSGAEEAEYAGLLSMIARIERTLQFGSGDAGTTALLVKFVENARGRLDALEREGRRTAEKEKEAAEANMQIAAAVEREHRLSEQEKLEYSALLEHEHFTKAEFGKLEHFYSNSWDKLTDDGKDEMSQRVWGGVRQGEYEFTELPEVVKEKEAQQMELVLRYSKDSRTDIAAIPENDRSDFLQARDEGKAQKSYEILDRPSYAEHAFARESKGTPAKAAPVKAEQTMKAEEQRPSQPAPDPVAAHGMGSKKLALQDFDGLDAIDAKLKPPLAAGNEVAAGKGGR